MYVRINVFMLSCLYARMVECMYVCRSVCRYVYTYKCMYVCMNARVCTYACKYACVERLLERVGTLCTHINVAVKYYLIIDDNFLHDLSSITTVVERYIS